MADDIDSIDAETLQAQIDLSMALAHELASSWVESSYGATSTKSAKDVDKELEEYMRRPPRLGVGAPLPESHALNGRGPVHLKNKLTGKGGRKRDSDELQDLSIASGDEEEESRAGAIKKKVKLDPFAVVAKGKKKKNRERQMNVVQNGREDQETPEVSTANADAGTVDDSETQSEPILVESAHGSAPSTPRKKTKKKQNRIASIDSPGLSSPLKMPLFSTLPFEARRTTPKAPSEEEWKGFSATTPEPSTSLAIDLSSVSTPGSVSPSKLLSPMKPLSPSKLSSPTRQLHSDSLSMNGCAPLLNLSGPPVERGASDAEGAASNPGESPSPKKRRRRKRKKKSFIANEDAEDAT